MGETAMLNMAVLGTVISPFSMCMNVIAGPAWQNSQHVNVLIVFELN